MIADLLRSLLAPAPPRLPEPDARLALAALLVRVARTDGLYSVEEIAGTRRWLKVGRLVDGWTIKSYDEKREVLTISQLGKVQELTLHKAIVDGLAVTYGNTTTASVKSGESTRFTTPEGVEVEVKVEVIQMTK